MTTAQVVEMSVTNNSLSKDYPYPDDHARPLGSNHLAYFNVVIKVYSNGKWRWFTDLLTATVDLFELLNRKAYIE